MAKFKVKEKYNLFDRTLRGICRKVKEKPTIINLNEGELIKKSILIGNHSGASGPFTYKVFFEHKMMTWGAHQMLEGYKSRWNYLYHVFYQQKLHFSKGKAWWSATSFGLVSRILYKSGGILPVYYDMRIKKTFKYSFECFDKDMSVLIFPENSDEGYDDIIEKDFHNGYLQLSLLYFRKHKEDLPIYTMSYSKKYKTLVIGKPMYLQEILKTHTMEEANKMFREYMNELHTEYILKPNQAKEEAEGKETSVETNA